MANVNALLTSLSQSDFDTLNPFFKTVLLESHEILTEKDSLISHVYFPTTCVISLVVPL